MRTPSKSQQQKEQAALRAADAFTDRHFGVLPPSTGIDSNWHVTDDADSCVAHCFGFSHDVDGGQGLAIRIAAALNYCQGISTSELIEALREEAKSSRRLLT